MPANLVLIYKLVDKLVSGWWSK